MCTPVALGVATLLIAVAGTGAGFYGQQQQAKSEYSYRSEAQKQATASAKQNFATQTNLEAQGHQQATESLAQAVDQNQKETAKAKTTAKVASAEAGVSGLSIDNLYADYDRSQNMFAGSAQRNLTFQRGQQEADMLGLRATNQNYINSSRFAPIGRPSALVAGGQIAGAGLDAYARYGYHG